MYTIYKYGGSGLLGVTGGCWGFLGDVSVVWVVWVILVCGALYECNWRSRG